MKPTDEAIDAAMGVTKALDEPVQDWLVRVLEAADAIAERDRLREALEPFARLSDRIPADYEDGRPDVTITLEKVPVKVIRRARAAMGESDE